MQPTLNTAAQSAGLFNLGPLIVVNVGCIPTVCVEMQPRLRNRWLFLKKCPEVLKIEICGVAFNNHLTCATAGGCLRRRLAVLVLAPRGRDAAKIYQTASVINVRRPLLGWAAIRRNAPPVGSSSTTNVRYRARAACSAR